MSTRSARVLRNLAAGGLLLALFLGITLSFLPEEATPQEQPGGEGLIEFFCAPSHLPSGEHWAIVGANKLLPEDVVAVANRSDVAVLETEVLSERAVAVRLEVPQGGDGYLFRLRSQTLAFDVEIPVETGQAVPFLTAPENYKAQDFIDGRLVVKRGYFMYGYLPSTEGGLSAVRIHNRQSGRWHRREYAIEQAIEESEAIPPEELPEHITVVDPFETLPDTDGDGIYDFEEEPEPEKPRPEMLGVDLVHGNNVLDIVAVDAFGNASWETIEVFTASQ